MAEFTDSLVRISPDLALLSTGGFQRWLSRAKTGDLRLAGRRGRGQRRTMGGPRSRNPLVGQRVCWEAFLVSFDRCFVDDLCGALLIRRP